MPARRLALPPITASRRRILIGFSVLIAAFVWFAIVTIAEPYDWGRVGSGHDARPYWATDLAFPYATSQVGAHNAYLYSPAFLQVIAPLRALPWQVFLGTWTVLLLGALTYLVGPLLLGAAVLFTLPELLGGNITLLIAAAIVAGFRWPAAWSFVLLTKVTPGVGLLWFAVRREWRSLAVAVFATAIVAGVSFVFGPPGTWQQWLDVLTANATRPIDSGSLPIPLMVRLPLALIVIAWAAAGNRRWALPIGCLLALPVIWYGSLSLLVAIVPLVRIPGLRAYLWEPIAAMAAGWFRRGVSPAESVSES